jgi:hypothetical protein
LCLYSCHVLCEQRQDDTEEAGLEPFGTELILGLPIIVLSSEEGTNQRAYEYAWIYNSPFVISDADRVYDKRQLCIVGLVWSGLY